MICFGTKPPGKTGGFVILLYGNGVPSFSKLSGFHRAIPSVSVCIKSPFVMNYFPPSLRTVVCIGLLFVSPSMDSFAFGNGGPSSEKVSLERLVYEYLQEHDAAKADDLNSSILRHPTSSVENITGIIRQMNQYHSAPVGMQPRQVVEVYGLDQSYGLFVPPTYRTDKPLPLVICLHGAGFTGDAYLDRWAPRLGDDYILACPTLSMGTWWTRLGEDLVLATIRAVQARYHIDPDRVYLTGMSNGGIGAWIIGMHHAHRFAGIAPMASGIDEVMYPFLENLRQTPLYIIHGAKDHVMPVWLSRDVTRELAQLGIAFVYREHEWTHPHAGGHFFPRQELPALVKWFDQQRRKPYQIRQTVVRDASHLSEFGWIRIDATDQIAMFSEQLMDKFDDLIKNRVYARLDVKIHGKNQIDITTDRVRRYTLFLNENLVDFSRPIVVTTNGERSFEGRVTPGAETLLREARRRQDFEMLFPVQLTLDVPR